MIGTLHLRAEPGAGTVRVGIWSSETARSPTASGVHRLTRRGREELAGDPAVSEKLVRATDILEWKALGADGSEPPLREQVEQHCEVGPEPVGMAVSPGDWNMPQS